MKKSTRILILMSLLTYIAVSAKAQAQSKPTVWIDPSNQYSNYLESAVLKKHTPVTFTTDKSSAQYIAALTANKKKGSVAKAVFLGAAFSGAHNDLSLSLSDAKTGDILFSYTCQKTGSGSSMQSSSECLAKHWTHFIEKGKP